MESKTETMHSFEELEPLKEQIEAEGKTKFRDRLEKLKWSNMSKGQQRLLLGAAGAAALYGVSRIPVVRTVALPIVAKAVSKNWSTISAALMRA
jgi:hypothetical protein